MDQKKKLISFLSLIWLTLRRICRVYEQALHCLVFISGGGIKCMEKRGLVNAAVGVNQMEILGCLCGLWFGR